MKKKISFFCIRAALILLSAICLLHVSLGSLQSRNITLMPQEFLGEYSRDGEHWFPLDKSADLSATKGDLLLRGHMLRNIPAGNCIYFFSNHLNMTVSVNGEPFYSSTFSQIEHLGPKYTRYLCGRQWSYWYFAKDLTTDDNIEIHLHNPHAPGNKNAYRDFLNTLRGSPVSNEMLRDNLARFGQPFRIVGLGILITSLMLIGASIAAGAMHIPTGGWLCNRGLLTLFAGCALVFDAVDISLLQNLIVLNTYSLWICIFLFVLWTEFLALELLRGKVRKTASAIVIFSAALDALIIIGAFAGWWLIHDAGICWGVIHLVCCPIMALCCLLQINHTDKQNKMLLFCCTLVFTAIVMDIFGIGSWVISRMNCTKIVFSFILIFYIYKGALNTVIDHQATMRAKRLETELEQSRISVMLSQIQPHFLYNALTAVMDLCDTDPQQAKEAIADFAHYLRGNLSTLTIKSSIPFRKELDHIRTYLRLEQLRFKERLSVEYSIETEEFFLPALSVQPIVENAVKHGAVKKLTGGKVHILAREEQNRYLVQVSDNGAGFDPTEINNDGKLHVGLDNIRARLNAVGASVDIKSEKGTGTVVSIYIPKERDLS